MQKTAIYETFKACDLELIDLKYIKLYIAWKVCVQRNQKIHSQQYMLFYNLEIDV